MNEPQAANPGGGAAPDQAASPQQGGQQNPPAPAQGGPAAPATGPQGGTPAEGAAPGAAPAPAAAPAAAAPTAPVNYQLRLPEQTPLDQSDVDAVIARAKEQGWSNDDAQAVLADMSTSLTKQAATFRTELDADPEVGGTKLAQAQAAAVRVLDRFLPATEVHGQRLRSVMNKTGYGNFLPLVTLLARIGQAMGEDRPGAGSARAFQPAPRSQADRLFGDAQGVKPPT